MIKPIAGILLFWAATLDAQGVTSSGIRGTVGPASVIDARVRIRHEATGFSVEVQIASGRFLAQGLEPGGPYSVVVRALGFIPQRREGIWLTLGELRDVEFVLAPITTRLDPVAVVAVDRPDSRASGGTGTTITESQLASLPTMNRDIYDFVRLVPQVSTKVSLQNPGLSAGGVGFRFNDFLINGVSERTLAGGVSSAFAGARSIPLDAVQEYQVLLAPYDVRYGDFTGALINAVTRSGSNDFHGSVFGLARNDHLARRGGTVGPLPYERLQYGFSLGGPLVRDRLHFFIAPELQDFAYPAAGPFVGQPDDAERPVPASTADLDRFAAALRAHGLTPGSAGQIENRHPLRNLFARVDLTVPGWNTRLKLWHNYAGSEEMAFSRAARDTFSLSSNRVTRVTRAQTTALHVHTTLRRAGGGHNELLLSRRIEAFDPTGAVEQPIVRVSVPAISSGRVTLNSGTHETGHGLAVRTRSLSLRETVTLPFGTDHILTLGTDVDRFRIRRRGALGSYGAWTFANLSDLELGIADRYEVRIDFGGAQAPLSGTQYAAYAGDQWQATDRLLVTGGLRADLLSFDQRAPYHALVDTLFGIRTDAMPRRRIELSPRVGFTWQVNGRNQHQLRGGAGIFTGRYPLGWAQTALASYGVGGTLRCSRAGPGTQSPPVFDADPHTPPTACQDGTTITTGHRGDVNSLDENLRMTRILRGSLAYDHHLAGGAILTNEALVTRALSDFVLVNVNLAEPQVTDGVGRVMYGTIAPSGLATPARRSTFSEVIDLRNTDRNHAWQLSSKLEKKTASGSGGSVSYTYSRARDVQTPIRVNTRGTVAWASARATAGRHDDMTPGISSNDVPRRVIVAGTYRAPWSRARTDLSFYYIGESGRPFTYLSYGALQLGDLNADGSSANDPIYVPRDATDPLEIRISGVSSAVGADNSPTAQAERENLQRLALERFIRRTPCLRRQRGSILERNSCREPWSNTTIASVRQAIPIGSRELEMQFDAFNVLNLLNSKWGTRREAAPALLEHVGQTAEPVATSRPIFRFATDTPEWTTVPTESAFQLQLGVRYRF